MRSKDWKPKEPARLLVIGEDVNLQWKNHLPEYALYADYYFRKIPYDLGERSRYLEAKNLFDMVKELTDYTYLADEVYVTTLSNTELEHAPNGKRTLIPEKTALAGIERIRQILKENPEIDLIFCLSMQANYWLQKSGLVEADELFVKGAEPRRTGISHIPPFYQPVNPKVFREICASSRPTQDGGIRTVALLPLKDYPLRDKNLEVFGAAYEALKKSFE